MRASSLVVLLIGMIGSFDVFGQQPTPGTYVPPVLTERLMQDDPVFNGANLWTLAADPAKFRATLEKQAASGKLLAQILLGVGYIPPECTFLPFKTAPADCPQDPLPNNPLGLTRSFDQAIHWLTLASAQGSGEASETLAQVIERAIQSPTPLGYRMADVAHYHAVARAQGYDLQDVEISCYTLDKSGPADRLIMAETPAEYRLAPHDLDALHAAGVSGTITFGGASINPGITTLLRHPEGPRVHTRVILGRPASHEMLVPMADRVGVVYLQEGDRIVTVPATYPPIKRKISFHPATAENGAGAAFQEIDGSFAGGCASPVLR